MGRERLKPAIRHPSPVTVTVIRHLRKYVGKEELNCIDVT